MNNASWGRSHITSVHRCTSSKEGSGVSRDGASRPVCQLRPTYKLDRVTSHCLRNHANKGASIHHSTGTGRSALIGDVALLCINCGVVGVHLREGPDDPTAHGRGAVETARHKTRRAGVTARRLLIDTSCSCSCPQWRHGCQSPAAISDLFFTPLGCITIHSHLPALLHRVREPCNSAAASNRRRHRIHARINDPAASLPHFIKISLWLIPSAQILITFGSHHSVQDDNIWDTYTSISCSPAQISAFSSPSINYDATQKQISKTPSHRRMKNATGSHQIDNIFNRFKVDSRIKLNLHQYSIIFVFLWLP